MTVESLQRNQLTTILATRNQPESVSAQLQLLERSGLDCSIIVADSSDASVAPAVRKACGCIAQYRHFGSELSLHDKLFEAISIVKTPYVLLCPDKKITFPHAIKRSLAHLTENADYVAALGYVIRYFSNPAEVDLNQIFLFTPSIADDDALQRHYNLMRRYQPSIWAVFRKDALVTAVEQARSMHGALFQEIMFMNALAIKGKIARLPVVFSLHGTDSTALGNSHPLYWFCKDSRSFFEHYVRYRNALAAFIEQHYDYVSLESNVSEIIDAIHAIWFQSNFDGGVLNHSVQLMLGGTLPRLPEARHASPRLEAEGNVVVRSRKGKRRYIWRHEVLNAEPKEEISISLDELEYVEYQLDHYFAD